MDLRKPEVHGGDEVSIKAYVIFGIILLVSFVFLAALCKVVRKADDEEREWREKHERNL